MIERWIVASFVMACVLTSTACQPSDEVWANGVHDELYFSAPRSPYAAPGAIDFRVARRVTTYDECGVFEFDECETTDNVPLTATTAEVSVLPDGLANVIAVESREDGRLRVQIAAASAGEARLVVRANGFFDEYPFELATPAAIRPVTEHGEWATPARILEGSTIGLKFLLLDLQGRKLFSSVAPSAEIEDGPAVLDPSPDGGGGQLFQAVAPGQGTLQTFHDVTGFTESLPFEVVGDEAISSARLKRIGEYPWTDEYSVTCNIGDSIGFIVDLRDAANLTLLGGGERFASSDPEIVSVQSSPQQDCDFRIATEDVIVADCLEDDGLRIRCESIGTASVSASFNALRLSVELGVR